MEGWEDQIVEERFQRDINYKRVKDHIAPYLVNDLDDKSSKIMKKWYLRV